MKTFYLNNREPIHLPGFGGPRRAFTEDQADVESLVIGKDGAVTVKLKNKKGECATVRVLAHGVWFETKETPDGNL